MLWDKKKAVSAIMSRRQHPDGSTSEAIMKPQRSTDSNGMTDPRHAAAEDMLAAFHENDPQKLMEAAANFHDLHKMHSEQAEDTEPDVPNQPDSED